MGGLKDVIEGENEKTETDIKAQTSVAAQRDNFVDQDEDEKNARLYRGFLRHMAYLVTLGFFGVLMMLFVPIGYDPNERELLSMLIGMLVSKWSTIIDFFYGSSKNKTGSNKES